MCSGSNKMSVRERALKQYQSPPYFPLCFAFGSHISEMKANQTNTHLAFTPYKRKTVSASPFEERFLFGLNHILFAVCFVCREPNDRITSYFVSNARVSARVVHMPPSSPPLLLLLMLPFASSSVSQFPRSFREWQRSDARSSTFVCPTESSLFDEQPSTFSC